jgi:hypothetical protein
LISFFGAQAWAESSLCSLLVKKIFLVGRQTVAAVKASPPSRSVDAPAKNGLQTGMKVSLPGIEWRKSSRTVLLSAFNDGPLLYRERAFLLLQIPKVKDTHSVAELGTYSSFSNSQIIADLGKCMVAVKRL